MRKLLTTFVCVWFTLAVWAGDGIYEKLQQIPQISEISRPKTAPQDSLHALRIQLLFLLPCLS